MSSQNESKSAEAMLFSHYLRTGERLHGASAERFLELKFNQRHYRENGQFARAGEGAVYGRGGTAWSGPTPRTERSTPPPLPRRQTGAIRNSVPVPPPAQVPNPATHKVAEGLAVFRRRGQAEFENWAQQPGGGGTYRTTAPDAITRFRQSNSRFRQHEQEILDASTGDYLTDGTERTLLVYRKSSPAGRDEFAFQVIKGDPKTGIMGPFRDPKTGKKLPFGQLPQMPGHELFIAEHVHPTPRSRIIGPKSHAGPSNSDLFHAGSNPKAYFIIRHIDRKVPFAKPETSFTYFGRDR